MRDGFKAISSGWMLQDGVDNLMERLHRLAEWSMGDGRTLNLPLLDDEQATVRMMINAQAARLGGSHRAVLEAYQRYVSRRDSTGEPEELT